MALKLPNRSALAIATTIGVAASMTAITNATEAVATLAAGHGVVEGDLLLVASGWAELDGRVVRAKTVATNDVTFEGIDTSSTVRFPAGSGIGSVQRITGWTAITQVLEITTSGGDQQYYQYQFVDAGDQRQIPTVRSAQSLQLSLGDDQSLPWYAAVAAADAGGIPVPLRVVLPTGAVLYYNGYWSMNKTPSLSVNNAMALSVAFALSAEVTRYAS